MASKKVYFHNRSGHQLSARLDLPLFQHPHSFAVFAHVFTGNKSLSSTRNISKALTRNGIGVLRFDFTGLGDSEGEFGDTNFSSNIEDIEAAASYLTENYKAPEIMIGHSLGGAAAVYAAQRIKSITALVTIAAPSEPKHVIHLLKDNIEEIERNGCARVSIGGRSFNIKKQFLDDLQTKDMYSVIEEFRKPILILHSPQDEVVGIENASKLYQAAHHPKSFITLDGANHMLTDKKNALYAGEVIGAWAERYIDKPTELPLSSKKQVVARLDEPYGYTTDIRAGKHFFLADEPEDIGGNNFGPTPYDLLLSSLGACTAMTLKMYARRKKWALKEVFVHLNHSKNYGSDCDSCSSSDVKIDHIERCIELVGELTSDQKIRLMEIADRCPVHKTLSSDMHISTILE